ncbi:MAG: TRAP transporter large permease [Tepidanaerobacter acetatoxydans]|uniref:TRAP transporter large permease n=1 Tax=Tepidanaerobacter acetatoxydans TaxID=499229 RepID=UPI0026E9A6C9|nr:TRAP transporter large permease [Tepidanaerobacter acetatoxydans]NLU10066.1 TRAP transporter large permease [Tepidanaerobacter acetatoxydans]
MNLIPLMIVLMLFLLNVPIGFSLIGGSMIYFIFMSDNMPPDLALQNFIAGLESFPLLAIPFFIMVGVVMNYSGISKRLMKFADLLVGHMRGGLAQVNVVLSALMGGISGSANADAAMQCKILVPEMEKRGYDTAFSAAITATSSIIPTIIPPGIMMILYCMTARVSVGKVFLAGYIPGLVITIILMIAVDIVAKKEGYGRVREKRASLKEILLGFKEGFFALIMPFLLILGLRFGVFTPTEGGAIAVAYSIVVGVFVYKELKWEHFIPIVKESLLSTAEVMFIIAGANLFGYYLSFERIPHTVAQLVLGISGNKYIFLFLINIFLLIVGMFVEGGPAIIIITPLLVPILKELGIDLVHFGIVITLNLAIGGITPPFGSMLFVCTSLLKISLTDILKANILFLIAILIALFVITYVPAISLFLPNLIWH